MRKMPNSAILWKVLLVVCSVSVMYLGINLHFAPGHKATEIHHEAHHAKRSLDIESKPQGVSSSANDDDNLLFYGTMDRPFATTIAELKLHLFQDIVSRQPQAEGGQGRPRGSGFGHGIYSNEDLQRIMSTSRHAADVFAGVWRLSGKTGLTHEIGTGSCMIHASAPGDYVALGTIHGIYFSMWGEQPVVNVKTKEIQYKSTHPGWSDSVCERRRWVAATFGDRFEHRMWMYYTMFGGKPEENDPRYWVRVLPSQADTNAKHLILFQLCDELEQYQGREQYWISNDRDRSLEFQNLFLKTIDMLSADPTMSHLTLEWMRKYSAKVFDETNALFDPKRIFNPTTGFFQEAEQKAFPSSHRPFVKDNKLMTEFHRTIENAFREAAEPLYVNWPQIPLIHQSLVTCRNTSMDMCVEEFDLLTKYYTGICCSSSSSPLAQKGPCYQDAQKMRLGFSQRKVLRSLGIPYGSFPDGMTTYIQYAEPTEDNVTETQRRDILDNLSSQSRKIARKRQNFMMRFLETYSDRN